MTIKQIVQKAVQVSDAYEDLQTSLADRQLAVDRAQAAATEVAAKQVVFDALTVELKALL